MPEILFELDAVSDRDTKKALADLLESNPSWDLHAQETCRVGTSKAAKAEPVIIVGDAPSLIEQWSTIERLRSDRHTALAVLVFADLASDQSLLSDLIVRTEALQAHFECKALEVLKSMNSIPDWVDEIHDTFESLIERMSPDRVRTVAYADDTVFVRFGDGLSRAFRWASLPFAARKPRLLPATTRVGEDHDAITIDDVDGNEFDVDALALRALFDGETGSQVDQQRRQARRLLGQRLKALREKRKITQKILAERSGIPQSSLSKIENGEREPRLDTLRKYAAGLGIELARLLEATTRE